MMRKSLAVLTIGFVVLLVAFPGMAQANKQQNKMAACNKEAGDKKGDERKQFLKECLSAARQSQQEKMKTCNASAKDKKGDERKAFMKECLSK